MSQEKRLNLSRIKGWKGYVHGGFKAIAKNYPNINWGKGTKEPTSVTKTEFKTTIKF